MNSLHIREFQEEDAGAAIALWQACGLVKLWNDPYKDIQRKLAVGRELFRESNLDVIQFYEAIGCKQDKVVSFGKRLIPDN